MTAVLLALCAAAAPLAFYRIGVEPVAMSSLPVGVVAAVLQAQQSALPTAERLARIRKDLLIALPHTPPEDLQILQSQDAGEVFIGWGSAALYLDEGLVFSAVELPESVPIEALHAIDWTDGSRSWIVARGAGVLAFRLADSLEVVGMVRMDDLLTGVVMDMRYATADNFTGVQLYPDGAGCYLLPRPAAALIKAGRLLAGVGLALLIYDCYRPLSVQVQMWAVFPKPGFVARPSATGSVHNRGGAVDVGLVDVRGEPVELPTDHDDFSPRAAASASGHSWAASTNRDTLQSAMRTAGFTTIRSEWWHFNGPGAASLAMDRPFPE